MSTALLIIFYRNPEIGKVKTRLAASIGDSAALGVYYKLSAHTKDITEKLDVDRIVYYSEFIDTEDFWSDTCFRKKRQNGTTLGERMSNAFQDGFNAGYKHIAIIGTDCQMLTSHLIHQGFGRLREYDVVVGPATDGGYYLLGMNAIHHQFFTNKIWSSDTVLADTLRDCDDLALKVCLLPELTDVDTYEDLPDSWKRLFN